MSGANAAQIVCILGKAAHRYKGQIEELIYVYCENDLKSIHKHLPFGTPEEVIAWLKDFATTEGIANVIVVYAPYVYNVVPQYTRFRGAEGERFSTHAREREALAEQVRGAGFRYIDIADVALAEAARAKTQFGALAVFSDHVHLSPYGITRLVERIRTDADAQSDTGH